MWYYLKYAITVAIVLFAIRLIIQLVEWIKHKGIEEYKKEQAWSKYRPPNWQALKRAFEKEKLYIAREFFLIPGVIRKRSCADTDEDDR